KRLAMTSGVNALSSSTSQLTQPAGRVLAALQHLHERRADHHAVDVIPQQLELLPPADPEACAYGHGRPRPYGIEITRHLARHRDILARRPRHGDRIYEALAARADL